MPCRDLRWWRMRDARRDVWSVLWRWPNERRPKRSELLWLHVLFRCGWRALGYIFLVLNFEVRSFEMRLLDRGRFHFVQKQKWSSFPNRFQRTVSPNSKQRRRLACFKYLSTREQFWLCPECLQSLAWVAIVVGVKFKSNVLKTHFLVNDQTWRAANVGI